MGKCISTRSIVSFKLWPSPKGTVPVARLPSAHVRRRASESLGRGKDHTVWLGQSVGDC
jgi:hypothetical protein